MHRITISTYTCAADKTEGRESEREGRYGSEVCTGRAEEHGTRRETTEVRDGTERFGSGEREPHHLPSHAAYGQTEAERAAGEQGVLLISEERSTVFLR